MFDRLGVHRRCRAAVAVLIAMGADPASARGSLRLSLGHTSTDADVDAALAVLPAAVERARRPRWPVRELGLAMMRCSWP